MMLAWIYLITKMAMSVYCVPTLIFFAWMYIFDNKDGEECVSTLMFLAWMYLFDDKDGVECVPTLMFLAWMYLMTKMARSVYPP